MPNFVEIALTAAEIWWFSSIAALLLSKFGGFRPSFLLGAPLGNRHSTALLFRVKPRYVESFENVVEWSLVCSSADWRSGNSLHRLRCSTSWWATSRSSVFDSTGKLEIRRYDLVSAGSKLPFFSRGVIYADLKTAGNMPDATDLLYSVVINGAVWWMLTNWMQDGSFHSWINRRWQINLCEPHAIAYCHAAELSVSVGQSAFNLI